MEKFQSVAASVRGIIPSLSKDMAASDSSKMKIIVQALQTEVRIKSRILNN